MNTSNKIGINVKKGRSKEILRLDSCYKAMGVIKRFFGKAFFLKERFDVTNFRLID
jgi:hypothetical protein